MTLLRLEVDDFRCFERVALSFDPRYNLFVGPNASGKTSLLEALFYIGRGRSFRTRRLDRLVKQGSAGFRIVGWCLLDGRETVLGVGGDRARTEIRIGGAAAGGAAELAGYFPPQVIDPEVHKLLEEGPQRRRRYLDWGVFHVEQRFLEVWQRYLRAVKQRNAALRAGPDGRAARAWDRELVAAGVVLAEQRGRYLEILASPLRTLGRDLLSADVTVTYHQGWPEGETLEQALERSFTRDASAGVTHVGPHRADVAVKVDGLLARERVSRGQQKLLAAALTLAQLRVHEQFAPGHGALLLDDPAAELDALSLSKLLAVVSELPAQLFVTALHADLPGLGQPGALFHVEHGTIARKR
jgi:DNA replication and repair protein RecF